MPALSVMIVRHGEKPGEDWPGPGFTDKCIPDQKSLVIRGWQRAGAWAALFGAGLGGTDYPPPTAVYAARPEGDGAEEPSQRPYETILPLCAKLKLLGNPITTWAKHQTAELAAEIDGLSGVVLVSWEHKLIATGLLPALLGSPLPTGVPGRWPGSRYDVVLRLDRADAGQPWSFRQLFPRLLSGDSDTPI